ncbi:tyrosine-type recombinase/integrase [Enterocloster clostridioformis]|uniref:site-specific tyrosine recombinase/integron integrase n=1 Tax=Enterocloster clostridioformis TaxID=1531 RepID=UPI001F2B52E5|nr:site-specific tyrosine recombinase/integron integrase [Enterocloster clostridioformis]MCF2703759.1 tyrosine-type recombinase/integrase [Enterocloster clostridioformis]
MDENKLKDELIAKLSNNVDTTILQMVDTALAYVLSDYEVARRNTQLSTDILRFPELEIYTAKLRFDNKAKSTIDQYSKFLGSMLCYVGKPVDQIQDFDIMNFLNYYAETKGISDSTKNHKRLISSSFFSFLHKRGYIVKNPMATVDAIKYTAQVREALTSREVERMRFACGENLRDNVVLELFLASGCRVSEVAGMQIENIDMRQKTVIVLGKGKKERLVLFSDRLLVYLEKYLNGRSEGPVVISVRAPHQGIKKNAIENIIREISKRAGIEKRVFPHLLRHTFATHALNRGMPLESLCDLMGHASIETTRIYAKNHMNKIQYEYDRYAS